MDGQTEQDLFLLRDLRKRNLIVCLVVTLLAALALVMMLSLHTSAANGIKIMIPAIVLPAALWYSYLTRSLERWIPITAILGLFVITLIPVIQNPGALTLGTCSFLVLGVGIVHNRPRLVATAAVAGLATIIIVYIIAPKDSYNFISEPMFIFYYSLTAVVLLIQSYLSSGVLKHVSELSRNATQLLESERQRDKVTTGATHTIAESMGEIRSASVTTQTSLAEMNTAFQEMSSGVTSQTEAIAGISENIFNSNQKLNTMVKYQDGLVALVSQTDAASHEGGKVISELTGTIDGLHESMTEMKTEISSLISNIHQISELTSSIQEISSQTALLSLNASIEAARAGEHGRGFEVVANEIRKLADLTEKSAKKITDNIIQATRQADLSQSQLEENQGHMRQSLELVEKTEEAFRAIDSIVEQLSKGSGGLTEVTASVKHSTEEIEQAVSDFVAVSEQSSATLEELLATVDHLAAQNAPLVERIEETDLAVKQLIAMKNSKSA